MHTYYVESRRSPEDQRVSLLKKAIALGVQAMALYPENGIIGGMPSWLQELRDELNPPVIQTQPPQPTETPTAE